MSELETTSQQLPTNKIFNLLREILDFYLTTNFEEDIIDVGNYVIAIFKDWGNDNTTRVCPGIEIFDSTENQKSVKLSIDKYGTEGEWISASTAVWIGDRFKELGTNGPTNLTKSIYNDQLIKKIIPDDFYNFLINLNIDVVKMAII